MQRVKPINFQDVGNGPFGDKSADSVSDVLSENQSNAQTVLRNWTAACTRGLPLDEVCALLTDELDRINSET